MRSNHLRRDRPAAVPPFRAHHTVHCTVSSENCCTRQSSPARCEHDNREAVSHPRTARTPTRDARHRTIPRPRDASCQIHRNTRSRSTLCFLVRDTLGSPKRCQAVSTLHMRNDRARSRRSTHAMVLLSVWPVSSKIGRVARTPSWLSAVLHLHPKRNAPSTLLLPRDTNRTLMTVC